MTRASQKAWAKRVEKWDDSNCKHEMNVSGKMRQSKRSRATPAKRHAKLMTSEILRQRLPDSASVRKDHPHLTEVHESTEPRRESISDLSLSHRQSNALQTGGCPGQKMHPTDKVKAYGESVHWDVNRQSPTSQPRFYWSRISKAHPQVDHDVYQEVNQRFTRAAYQEQRWSRPDGHRSALQTIIPESGWIYKSMPSMDVYWLHDIFSRAWESLQRALRAQVRLNLVSINIWEKLTY